MADLLNVGLKMREWLFRELAPKFPNEGGAMSLTPLPPEESAPLALYFLPCQPGMVPYQLS